MAKYIMLLNYTQQGISKVRESPNRAEAARGCCQSNANQSPKVPVQGFFRPPVHATRPERLSGSV
jgi:hypothetical protein